MASGKSSQASSEFVPGFRPSDDTTEACYVVFAGGELLMDDSGQWQPLAHSAWRFASLIPIERHHLGTYRGRPAYAVDVEPGSNPPRGYNWSSLRWLLANGGVGQAEFALIGSGLQVFNWDRSHQYCGQCGGPTVPDNGERARVCERCQIHYYPRISPCVIGLITRGDECLLANHANHRTDFYSPLAGFIEPGESAEGALHREVAEEVSLKIGNVRYFGSQPWPFPGQLMLGFHADYESGDIVVDPAEIVEARWWHYRDLPSVPPAGTLSGMLIEQFVNSRK